MDAGSTIGEQVLSLCLCTTAIKVFRGVERDCRQNYVALLSAKAREQLAELIRSARLLKKARILWKADVLLTNLSEC